MSEQWTDRDDQLMRDGASPLDLDAGDKAWIELAREQAAQRKLAPAQVPSGRTPQQRAADARARARENDRLAKAGLRAAIDAHYEMIQEQAARITMLHDRIEQQQTGARHLAGRIDKLEQELDMHLRSGHGGVVDSIVMLQNFQQRVTARFPSVGTPSLQQQCDAAWRAPTKEESGD